MFTWTGSLARCSDRTIPPRSSRTKHSAVTAQTSLFRFDIIQSSTVPLFWFLPLPKVFHALQAMPAQPLAVNANVELFPSFPGKHQPTALVAPTAAGL